MTYRRYYNFGKLVFLTIVTYKRIPILINNINLVRQSLQSVKYKYKIIAGVILNDHIHMIIEPENMNDIPMIISFFKQNFSKNCKLQPLLLNNSRIKKEEKSIWQRRYYDHIIRDEKDLNRHLDYIHYNPMKHYNINPKDWKYSSFKKFVIDGFYDENWCNFEDTNNISVINLE